MHRPALAGNIDEAIALIGHVSPLDRTAHISTLGYQVMVTGIAGSTAQATRLAATFIDKVDRFSAVHWHAELVLLLAICRLHNEDAPTALTYLEAAKQPPMSYPYWYERLAATRHRREPASTTRPSPPPSNLDDDWISNRSSTKNCDSAPSPSNPPLHVGMIGHGAFSRSWRFETESEHRNLVEGLV